MTQASSHREIPCVGIAQEPQTEAALGVMGLFLLMDGRQKSMDQNAERIGIHGS